MIPATDSQDLLSYCATGSEPAFRRLVERHAPMVHGVAVRMLRSASLAEDITQAVFVILARKAPSIPPAHLAGWLHNAASGECRNAIRKEARRRQVTVEYTEAMNMKESSPEAWNEIVPHLDEAVGKLSWEDRQMVILRYFEQRNFHEIAAVVGASEEACKKRAQRALDRLGAMLRQRGVTAGGPAVGAAVAGFALLPPSASAAAISTVALSSAGSLASGPPSFFKLIQYMTTKQVTTVAAVPAFKLLTALPPLLALSAGAIWTVSQSRATASLESRTALYQRSLDAASRVDRRSGAEGPKASVAVLANGRIDWKSFSDNLKNSARMVAMKKRLRGMSPAELIAEFDEIGKLDVSDRGALQEVVLESLAFKDPKAVIERSPNDPGDHSSPVWYAHIIAFRNWSQSSPEEAAKWLDQKIDSGVFNSTSLTRNPHLNTYETPMICGLLQTDPQAAAARLQNLPQQQQGETLQGVLEKAKPEQGPQLAALIQATLRPDQWEEAVEGIEDPAKRTSVQQGMAKAAAEPKK